MFTLFWALLLYFTIFYAFCRKTRNMHISRGEIIGKNYRKPINLHFSNYRQKYQYRFKTSSNYRWFEEIIDIDIEIDRKIIEKLSLSKKMTYSTPLLSPELLIRERDERSASAPHSWGGKGIYERSASAPPCCCWWAMLGFRYAPPSPCRRLALAGLVWLKCFLWSAEIYCGIAVTCTSLTCRL